MLKRQGDAPARPEDTRVLVTAEEAYPEFERAFLDARTEIWGSFRVFDLWTRLRSPEARAIGRDWFDLVVHTLRRGVRINMVISDFDPIMADDLHCMTWRSMRAFLAAGEAAGPDAPLHVVAATHPSRIGTPMRQLFWPFVRRRLKKVVDQLNGMEPKARALRLDCLPGIRALTRQREDGTLKARHWPPDSMLPATHHQKIAVFDRRLLTIGGLDLDERRYDDTDHRRRRDETWHDVQLMVEGPIVDEAQTHLETFLGITGGFRPPPETGRLLTTLSRRRNLSAPYLGPKTMRETIAEAHGDCIAGARQLIYLETQFFRDTRLAGALARAGEARDDLGLILVLPGAPEDVAFDHNKSMDARYGEHLQYRSVQTVLRGFGRRAAICSPVRPVSMDGGGRDTLAGAPIVYVHAKVSIFDRDRAIISSANLNGRSLRWDTEAGLLLEDAERVEGLRRRIMTHWLGDDPPEEFFDPATAAAAWRARAAQNLGRPPEERTGFLVPYDPGPAGRWGRPLPGIPEEMV